MSKEKIIILLTVFVDVLGIGIVIPVMPYFVKEVGGSPVIITTLFAIFSLFSFFSAPILGALSDRIGRRPVLIISLASTALGWFVFGAAKTVVMLFAGRIIDGAAAGNFPIAQSYMADLSKDAKQRTQNMGLMGAIFGIGFIIGPAIGALLSHISITTPFYFVGALATINTIAAIFFLPETNKNKAVGRKISINPFRPIIMAATDKLLKSRYLAWFLFSLGISVQQAIFALYMQHAFNLSIAATGYVMVAMGLILVLNQAFLLKHVWLKYFKESTLEIWVYLFFGISFLIMAVPQIWIFAIGIIGMAMGQSIIRAVVTSRITGFAEPSRRGEVAGIMSSVMTLAMVIGPFAIGPIYLYNEHWPFIIAGLVLFMAFAVMYRCCGNIPEEKFEHQETEPVEVIS
ncbi:MAG: MFS transporter [Candidatus Falkowbacteria bacterium]